MSEEEKISSAVAFTIITELRDQLQIKDMRIRKLKEKNFQLKELLKKYRLNVVNNTMAIQEAGKGNTLLIKEIDEALK